MQLFANSSILWQSWSICYLFWKQCVSIWFVIISSVHGNKIKRAHEQIIYCFYSDARCYHSPPPWLHDGERRTHIIVANYFGWNTQAQFSIKWYNRGNIFRELGCVGGKKCALQNSHRARINHHLISDAGYLYQCIWWIFGPAGFDDRVRACACTCSEKREKRLAANA